MRKNIVVIAAMLPVSLLAQSKPSVDQYEVKRGEKIGNCTGNKGNICEFEKIEGTSSITLSRHTTDQIVLTVDFSKMNEVEKKSWLEDKNSISYREDKIYFVQNTPIQIQPELLKDLHIDTHLDKIAEGDYPITLVEDRLSIIFNLTQ